MSITRKLGLHKIFGTKNDRYLKTIQPLVDRINALEPHFQQMTDDELCEMTTTLKTRYTDGKTIDNLLPEAFALVREASLRTLGLRHYDVQLLGGIILHQGKITEMKTGEGKTLVSTLASYLNALTGKGVHVVTVNDYLAKRDSEWMGQIFEFLGMKCSYIIHGLTPAERRDAYNADIVYATNNELGFDYLRDNMAFFADQLVQRDLHYAIVDEVDSILIDEARTPLVISGPTEDKSELYKTINTIIPQLKADVDYIVDEKTKTVSLTDDGTDHAEEVLISSGIMKEGNLYDMTNVMLLHHLQQALKAYATLKKDVDYIIKDNKIVLIDEFTGRMTPGRRFGEGLHQALEAKEGTEIQNENQTLASITFQNYFRLYEKLSGMTGTAETEAEEFETIYSLPVIILPTHVPVTRIDETDIIYRSSDAKLRAIIADIEDCAKRGQPILVGTTSIEKSEELGKVLKKQKIAHSVLNARFHEKEAEIIAQAGRLGAVTIATNMAGRGTDIKLGGNIDLLLETAKSDSEKDTIQKAHKEEKAKVIEMGGLRVLSTERHESRRIDNQLRGRSGRQGDPGSSVFYISLQDDLMRLFAKNLDAVMERMDMPEDEAIQSRLVSAAIETAQRKIEGRNFEIRKNLLKYDNVLNDQRKHIYENRRDIMTSEKVDDIIIAFREEALAELTTSCFPPGTYLEQWNVELFKEEVFRLYNIKPEIDAWLEEDGVSPEDIASRTQARMEAVWNEKCKRVGDELMRKMEKTMLLQVLDQQWKDHLQRLDYLRQGIHLRGYGQKDPLNEFKTEAFAMFAILLDTIRDETTMLLSRSEIKKEDLEAYLAQMQSDGEPEGKNNFAEMDIPRNAQCPCGSGKKYKRCHGQIGLEQATA